MAISAVFVSSSSFTVSGDRAGEFTTGRKVEADCGADGIKYGTVLSSSYDGGTGLTTITLKTSVLTVGLAAVLYGIVDRSSLPDHSHSISDIEDLRVPFVLADGTQSNIAPGTDGALPFWLADGTESDIPMTV